MRQPAPKAADRRTASGAERTHSQLTRTPAAVTIFRTERLELGPPGGALHTGHKLITCRNRKGLNT